MRKTDALLRIGQGSEANYVMRQASRAGRPVYDAQLIPSSIAEISGNRWLAFAGIGNPSKFFASVQQAGGEIVDTRIFADHYAYEPKDINELQANAARLGIGLITTAKDQVRLATMRSTPKEFLKKLAVLDVELKFDRTDVTGLIINKAIEKFKARS